MPAVHEEFDLPNGDPDSTLHVLFTLVGSLGTPIVGFVEPDITLVSSFETDVDVNGEYTVTLAATETITPSGTRWKREVLRGHATVSTEYLEVTGSSPLEAQDILDEAPASVPGSALSLHIDDRTLGSHIPDGPTTPGYVLTIDVDGVTPIWAVASGGGGGGLTQEQIEDAVGAMFSGNTETGITATYQDNGAGLGKIDLATEVTAASLATSLSAYLTTAAAAAAYQPLDGDLTTLSSAGNSAVLAATTASFLTAQATKLGHITVTQAVDLDAIETRVNDLDAAVVLRGTWDASTGTFPGGGTAQAGSSYIVSVAGTVDGVAFALNDRAIAITDNASTTTFANNWFKADYTDQVLSVDGRTGVVTLSDLYQPLDTDLTSISALATTAYGRDFLTRSNAAAGIAYLGLDASLTSFALPDNTTISTFAAGYLDETTLANTLTALGLDTSLASFALPDSTTISTFGASLVDDANAAAGRTTLGVPDVVNGARITTTPGSGTLTFAVDLTQGQSGGDSLTGGSGANETLTLNSTSSSTRGKIVLRDFVTVTGENKTAISSTPMRLLEVPSTRTFSLNQASLNSGNSLSAYYFEPTITVTNPGAATEVVLFQNAAVYKNPNGAALTSFGVASFISQVNMQGDGALLTSFHTGFYDAAKATIINAGTTAITLTGFQSAPTVEAGATISSRTGFTIGDISGAGTATTNIGGDIAAQAKGGTTNIGLRIAKANTYTLQLSSTAGDAASGITWGTDTNLYRSVADTLRSDDNFVAALSIKSIGATSGIGYGTGAGGTVTQATSKATGVTLNKATGQITMNAAALAADTTVSFTLTNSAIEANDILVLNHRSAGTAGAYTLNAQCAAGTASVNVRNVTAGSLSEAIVISFAVVKAVAA